jgi:hypothetical protein
MTLNTYGDVLATSQALNSLVSANPTLPYGITKSIKNIFAVLAPVFEDTNAKSKAILAANTISDAQRNAFTPDELAAKLAESEANKNAQWAEFIKSPIEEKEEGVKVAPTLSDALLLLHDVQIPTQFLSVLEGLIA